MKLKSVAPLNTPVFTGSSVQRLSGAGFDLLYVLSLSQKVSPPLLLVFFSAALQALVPTRSPTTLKMFGCPSVGIHRIYLRRCEECLNGNSHVVNIFYHMVSSSHIRSSDWPHGKEVLWIQEVHASWLDGWSKVYNPSND